MEGYESIRDGFILQVNNNIVGKSTPDSIDPSDVGGSDIDLATLLTDFIGKINNFDIDNGTLAPIDAIGEEGDYYVQTNGGVSLKFFRKGSSSWDLQSEIPLGVSYEDGIISGLRTFIDTGALSVEAVKGSWAINNSLYSKSTSTFINYDSQPVGVNRIDTIYANTSGQILYIAGAPSSTPVKPTLPANTIEVDSIYIPASGTGTPYLFSSGGSTNSDSSVTSRTFNNGDIDVDGNLSFSVPEGKTIIGADITQIIGGNPVRSNIFPSYDATKIYGFNKLVDPDTQTIILKIA